MKQEQVTANEGAAGGAILNKALEYETPKKLNPLDGVKDVIAVLKIKNATAKEIHAFLVENNVKVSINALKSYIRNEIGREEESRAKELVNAKAKNN